ncbi:MAG TPA: mismatch-specific DNA-glycosylase [Nitrospiraceae bacterium]|nr:mismatch-specific DNA-glycosylase [Nitrospiraceae bacterium]
MPGTRYRGLPDYVDADVRVLLVGINPGLRSALLGHHFAGYSNRFWKVLYRAGLVPEPITYLDDWRLPNWGFGLTNLVTRPTASVDQLTKQHYEQGRARLLAKIARYQPPAVALLGITLHSALLQNAQPGATVAVGLQPLPLLGSALYVLPNPSGRNAHYSVDAMVEAFRALKTYLRTP